MGKYGNIVTSYNGEAYDSGKEAQYAKLLDSLKKAKDPKERVVSWERQVTFPIHINAILVCKYIADFRVSYADGHVEVVDVKGFKTAMYRLKKKLVFAAYDIDITEV